MRFNARTYINYIEVLNYPLRSLQVVDSGLDQESCFFRDEDGEQVEGGYYFDEILVGTLGFIPRFTAGSFPMDLERRKVHAGT